MIQASCCWIDILQASDDSRNTKTGDSQVFLFDRIAALRGGGFPGKTEKNYCPSAYASGYFFENTSIRHYSFDILGKVCFDAMKSEKTLL